MVGHDDFAGLQRAASAFLAWQRVIVKHHESHAVRHLPDALDRLRDHYDLNIVVRNRIIAGPAAVRVPAVVLNALTVCFTGADEIITFLQ
jgi:hypothetical protein